MRLNQFLQRATPTEADALAACWGVLPEDVLDGRRAWVQATTPGDAAGPRVVQLHDRTLTVYAHPGEPTPKWVPRFLAVRAFVDPATVAATERSTVELDDADEGLVPICTVDAPPLTLPQPHLVSAQTRSWLEASSSMTAWSRCAHSCLPPLALPRSACSVPQIGGVRASPPPSSGQFSAMQPDAASHWSSTEPSPRTMSPSPWPCDAGSGS